MDQILSMRVFCVVAETLRFRAASTRFSMSPAMVSKHVAALESRVGARLLMRNSRHVVLTDEGRSYFQRVQSILEELDEIEASVSEKATKISGAIRISAPVWMANKRFAEILKSFTDIYSDVTFDIDLSARQVNLIEEGYDLALRVSPKLAPGLIAKPLMPITFGLFAAPHYLENHDSPNSIEQIFDHPMLVYSGAPRLEEQLKLNRRRATTIETKNRITSESEVLLLQASRIGMGLVVLPDWLADADLAQGSLVRLLPDQFDVKVRLHAVYSSRRLLPARVRKFLNHL